MICKRIVYGCRLENGKILVHSEFRHSYPCSENCVCGGKKMVCRCKLCLKDKKKVKP